MGNMDKPVSDLGKSKPKPTKKSVIPPTVPAPPAAAQALRPGKGPNTPKRRDNLAGSKNNKLAKRGRLPEGSEIHCKYDSTKEEWSGILQIVTVSGGQVFTNKASGLFYLLERLDTMYRNWLKRPPVPEEKVAEESAAE